MNHRFRRFVRDRRLHRRAQNDQSGFVAVEFIAGVGFLLLPVALLVLMFPTWWERMSMARVASREAARVYVVTGDAARAQAAVDQISANYRLKDTTMTLELEGNPRTRGGTVKATVTTKIPVTNISLLHLNADAFELEESHSEVVDLYRAFP